MTTGSIQSVQRALQLLKRFAPDRPQWSVTELARSTGLHKSVVTRLMATMALEGFVVQDPTTRTYSIGPQAFAVGSMYRPYALLEQLARPVLQDLMIRSNHSTSLGVPAGDRFLTLISIQSNQSIRVAFEVGQQPYYHSASVGKALLAGMDNDRIRELLGPGPLPKVTPYTTESLDALLEELERIRETGIAISREESIIGVGGVAAPVKNSLGECIAAVGIAYPAHVVTEADITEFGRLVREGAETLSQAIGSLSLQQI